jgi:hypothetical protein
MKYTYKIDKEVKASEVYTLLMARALYTALAQGPYYIVDFRPVRERDLFISTFGEVMTAVSTVVYDGHPRYIVKRGNVLPGEVKFNTSYTVCESVTLTPSEVYKTESSKDRIAMVLEDNGLKVVAFRPPGDGENFITAPRATVGIARPGEGPLWDVKAPRFIVEKLTPFNIDSVWE